MGSNEKVKVDGILWDPETKTLEIIIFSEGGGGMKIIMGLEKAMALYEVMKEWAEKRATQGEGVE